MTVVVLRYGVYGTSAMTNILVNGKIVALFASLGSVECVQPCRGRPVLQVSIVSIAVVFSCVVANVAVRNCIVHIYIHIIGHFYPQVTALLADCV